MSFESPRANSKRNFDLSDVSPGGGGDKRELSPRVGHYYATAEAMTVPYTPKFGMSPDVLSLLLQTPEHILNALGMDSPQKEKARTHGNEVRHCEGKLHQAVWELERAKRDSKASYADTLQCLTDEPSMTSSFPRARIPRSWMPRSRVPHNGPQQMDDVELDRSRMSRSRERKVARHN
jgi:hypothetical protein